MYKRYILNQSKSGSIVWFSLLSFLFTESIQPSNYHQIRSHGFIHQRHAKVRPIHASYRHHIQYIFVSGLAFDFMFSVRLGMHHTHTHTDMADKTLFHPSFLSCIEFTNTQHRPRIHNRDTRICVHPYPIRCIYYISIYKYYICVFLPVHSRSIHLSTTYKSTASTFETVDVDLYTKHHH